MKSVIVALCAVAGAWAAGATLYGCNSAPPHPLVGRWEMTQTVDGAVAGVTTLLFQRDGTMRLEVVAPSAGMRNSGRWDAEGAEVTFAFSKCELLDAAGAASAVPCETASATATFSIASDTLTLVTSAPGVDPQATTVLRRR